MLFPRHIILLLFCFVAAAATLSLVNAQAASIWTTYDTNPTHHQNQFAPGQAVYIFWAPAGSTQNIQIRDSANNILAQFNSVSTQPQQWQIPPDAAPGTMYWIEIPGVPDYPIAVATVQVLPELSWGPLTAAILGFVVFGAFSVVKNKKKQA